MTLEEENKRFEEWANSVTTAHCYFMRGANKVYAGLISGGESWCFRFNGMTIDEARRRIKIKGLRTNKDEHQTVFDKAILDDCRKLCKREYKIDVGLGYQVHKGEGR